MRTPTYESWAAMLTRVRNPNRDDWPRYGGRGIGVCKRWLKFKNFLADMGERPNGTTLDRKNTNGNYCKRNCRWSTPLEQVRNRPKGFFRGERNNQAVLTWDEVRIIRSEWDVLGHAYATISKLAVKFNVSFGCIHKVVYNQTWQGG